MYFLLGLRVRLFCSTVCLFSGIVVRISRFFKKKESKAYKCNPVHKIRPGAITNDDTALSFVCAHFPVQ